MAEKSKKKQIKLGKTAAGAQQIGSIKDWEALQNRFEKDMDKVHDGTMTRAEFKKKYGKTVSQTQAMLYSADSAAKSINAEKNPRHKNQKEFWSGFEKFWAKKSKEGRDRNFASGGTVKSRTGVADYRKGGMVLSSKDNRKKK